MAKTAVSAWIKSVLHSKKRFVRALLVTRLNPTLYGIPAIERLPRCETNQPPLVLPDRSGLD